MLINNN